MAAVEIEQPSSPTIVLTLETALPKTDTDNQSFSSTSTDRKTSSSTSASSNKDPSKRIRYSVRTPQTMTTISPTETDDSQSKKVKRRSFSFFKNNAKGEKKKDLSEKLNRSSDKRRLAKSQTAEKKIKRRSFMDIFHSSSESEIESDVSKHTRSRSLSLGKPSLFNDDNDDDDDLDQNSSSLLPDSKSKRRSLIIPESYTDEDRTRNNRKNRLSLNLDLFTSKSSTRGIPSATSTSIGIPSFLTNSLSIISAPTSPAAEKPKGILKRSLSQGQKIYKTVESAVKSNSYKNELGGSEVNTPATSLAEADVGENVQDNDFADEEGLGKGGETEEEYKDRKNSIENKNKGQSEGQNRKEFDSSKLDDPNLLSPPLSPSLPPPPPTTPTPVLLTSALNATPILNFTEAFVESPVDVYRNNDSKMTDYEASLRNKVSEISSDTLFKSQRTEQPLQQPSYEALLIRQLNLTERMEATLRRWEDKFGGDETDKQEDKEEAVVSETVERKEDEQFKDDTRTDQLALSINMQEKVKSLETQLSEQKAELDVLREVVLDLRSNQQLLITGDLSSYDPSNLSVIHSRLTGFFPPHQKSSQSTTSILVNSLVVKPVAATVSTTYNIANSVIQTLYVRPFFKIVKVVWHKGSSEETIQN